MAPMTSTAAAAMAILSHPVKDIYTLGKDKFGVGLSKWSNSRSVNALAKKVSAYEKVKTIWQRDKDVKLTTFYYPSRVTFHTDTIKKVSSLKDIPQTGGLVIQGTVGQGKSIFLRYLCIQELRSQSSGRIPVLVELRKLDSETTLKSLVFTALGNLGFEVSDELFNFYADSGKLVLLLDGFDELNEGYVLPVITQLENWAERYPKFQVIVSSRPGAEIQKSSHFTVLRLAPLGIDDHKPFLSKIGVKGKQLENLLAAVEQSPSQIKEFLNTPLLLTLLSIVYQSDGTIPAELPEFFQVLFATVFSKHDGTKPGFKRPRHTELNDRNLELLFESFCFSVIRRNYGVSLNDEEFSIAYDDAAKFRGERCDHTAFRHDLVKVACLLLEDADKLSFAHKSLLEYFCASFIKHATEKQAEKIYSAICTQRHWRSVLQYASYIDKYKYAKYFGIPKLTQTFSALGFSPDVITSQNADKAISFVFGKCRAYFHRHHENEKYRQNGISHYESEPTIYIDKVFFSALPECVVLIDDEFTEDELKFKFPNIIEESEPGGEKSFYLPWMELLSEEKRNSILKNINKQLLALSEQLRSYNEYVNAEDNKASEFATFDFK